MGANKMGKRIFRNVVFTAILTVLLTAALIVLAMYDAHEDSVRQELMQEAGYIIEAMEISPDPNEYLKSLSTNNRITLVAGDGTVIFDNAADFAGMENHASRPEIVKALSEGQGESTRPSDTMALTTLYYAERMDNGQVLRIANTRLSVAGAFVGVLPLIIGMLLGVVLLSLLIAKRAARRIVAPINMLNLDAPLENDAYDELAPLLSRMEKQHGEIREHVKALETARSELSAIMDNMREGMILLDAKEHILSMNQSAADIFDVAASSHIGENLLSISRDTKIYDLVQQALKGDAGNLTTQHNDCHYQIFVSPVMCNAQIRGVVLLILDVTQRFKAEESRREFTANVSHELKTPLTAISGFAEIIRDGIARPEDIQHFAGMILKESARLITLVNDILELSQLDEKHAFGQMESVDLLSLLQGLMDDFALAAKQKNLIITLLGEKVHVSGYPVMLREMFFNLIDNAVKYTPEGGSITMHIQAHGDGVCFVISDTGIGIAQEHHAHVFERFYRVDKSHSRQTGGTGLGLAIVKHIALIHHAGLSLESSPGKGTAITIEFMKASA